MLTHEQVRILDELNRFVETPNSLGQYYTIVGVPSDIFRKLIIGLGLSMPTINQGHVPSAIIRERTEQLYQEYLKKNPGAARHHYARLQAENTAIIEYLDKLHQRGKI